jgi:hypothetical protein
VISAEPGVVTPACPGHILEARQRTAETRYIYVDLYNVCVTFNQLLRRQTMTVVFEVSDFFMHEYENGDEKLTSSVLS